MTIVPKNIDRRSFDDLQHKKLGNYVYALRDPRDNKVFYIGQATQNNRIFEHFKEAEEFLNGKEDIQITPKILRIIEIWASDEDVDWYILSHGLTHETNILDAVESAAIDLLSICQNGSALNLVSGPHSSLMTKEVLNDWGASPINPSYSLQSVFIFPIQRQLADGVSAYESTRRAWYVAEKHRNLEGALAVGLSNYISRCIYSIDNWHNFNEKHEFDGHDANLLDLVDKNWHSIISKSIGYWQRGNYFIIEFNGKGKFRFIRGNPDKQTWYDLENTSN